MVQYRQGEQMGPMMTVLSVAYKFEQKLLRMKAVLSTSP